MALSRSIIESIILSTLAAVAPESLVHQHVRATEDAIFIDEKEICIGARPISCLGAGKASSRMAQAITHLMGKPFDGGSITSPDRYVSGAAGCSGFAAGHPLPDERSMISAREAIRQARHWAKKKALVVGTLSGGASALWCLPRGQITLAQKIELGRWLLSSGLSIDKMNTIRRRLSAIKGGHLGAALAGAETHVLVMSDVPRHQQLDVVGSGPFHRDTATNEDALRYLNQATVAPPSWLTKEIENAPSPPGKAELEHVFHHQIGSNQDAVTAVALKVTEHGFYPVIDERPLEGEAAEVGRMLAEAGMGNVDGRPTCLVYGGETTVTLSKEFGLGGRNQEMALAFGLAAKGNKRISLLAFSTDGIDGISDAAGAYVDGTSVEMMYEKDLDPVDHLARHDSHPALAAIDALVKTGPTSTNVADVALVFIE